jgi:hypothetical protein
VPKVLREALEFLASTNQVGQLTALIQEQIRMTSPDAEEHLDPFPLSIESNIQVDWSEGVEDLRHLTTKDLYQQLGYDALPFFNEMFDPLGTHDPWISEHMGWFKDPANGSPLVPRWHQLLGIFKMVKASFAGNPILLMDEVGLGKTLQAVGVIATHAFYREFHTQHKRFPGAFGTSESKPNLSN